MQIVTKSGLIAEVAERFKVQYFVRGKGWKQYNWDCKAMYEQLKTLPQMSLKNKSYLSSIVLGQKIGVMNVGGMLKSQ